MARTLGNLVTLTCLAIFRLGANFESGSSISFSSSSGFVAMAFLSASIAISPLALNCSEVDVVISCSRSSRAFTRRHFSHLKSSIYSVLNIWSKQELRLVELT